VYSDGGSGSTDGVSEALYSGVIGAAAPQAIDGDLLQVWTHV